MSLVANLSFMLNGNNLKSIVKIEAFSSTLNYLIMLDNENDDNEDDDDS